MFLIAVSLSAAIYYFTYTYFGKKVAYFVISTIATILIYFSSGILKKQNEKKQSLFDKDKIL